MAPSPANAPDRVETSAGTGSPDRLEPPAGVPDGWREAAAAHWRAAEKWAGRAALQPETPTEADLADRLVTELTAPLRLEDWPPPKPARPSGGGWIHDEVIDEDRAAFEEMLAAWTDGYDRPPGDRAPFSLAEAVARAAQELRWPVTPYRRLPTSTSTSVPTPTSTSTSISARTPEPAGSSTGAGRLPKAGRARTTTPVVIDLTTHWAGPLAGGLLAEAGARVLKIDPECRPDGFRSRPNLYHHLNGAKEIVDLDLRVDTDRSAFERLIGGADLIIESFSRRVLPNLGYDLDALHRLNPELALVSLRAFPAGTPEADWLAYGPGVHAASGLGMTRAEPAADPTNAEPAPAPVAYPDLVAGVAAYAAAVGLLGGRYPTVPANGRVGAAVRRCEVTLAGSIEPLVDRAAESARCGEGDRG